MAWVDLDGSYATPIVDLRRLAGEGRSSYDVEIDGEGGKGREREGRVTDGGGSDLFSLDLYLNEKGADILCSSVKNGAGVLIPNQRHTSVSFLPNHRHLGKAVKSPVNSTLT